MHRSNGQNKSRHGDGKKTTKRPWRLECSHENGSSYLKSLIHFIANQSNIIMFLVN